MRRRLVLLAIVGTLAASAGCNRKGEDAAPTGVKVGLILPDASQPYYQALRRAVDRVAAERGYEVLAEDGAGKAATQTAALERLTQKGVNAVLVASIDPDGMEAAVDGAVAKNVYAVLMEQPIEDAEASSTVVFNHELAGQLLADFLGSELKSGGSVALLTGGGSPGEKKRAVAFRNYLADEFPNIKIAAEAEAKAAEAPAAAKKLVAGNKLDAVVALNANAGAAAAAAIGSGAGKPFVATYGGREDLIAALKTEGPIRLVVEPLPQWLGDRSAKLAWRIVTNKPSPSLVELPVQPVTRENLDTYLGWDGVIPENMNVPWTSELSLQVRRED